MPSARALTAAAWIQMRKSTIAASDSALETTPTSPTITMSSRARVGSIILSTIEVATEPATVAPIAIEASVVRHPSGV